MMQLTYAQHPLRACVRAIDIDIVNVLYDHFVFPVLDELYASHHV